MIRNATHHNERVPAPDDGCTPLHLAALSGNEAMVELLIGRGVAIDASDRAGRTPLSTAISAGHGQIVDLLQRHGARP